MKVRFKAESILSVLIAISLFSLMFLSYRQWQSLQHWQENRLYQKQQALQIAENQLALRLANRACKRSVTQNNLQFVIECSDSQIKVGFPLGEIKIVKP